jgi:ribonuclease T2
MPDGPALTRTALCWLASAIAVFAILGLGPSASAQFSPRASSGTPGEFDFYVLALSWSPGFCELEGRRKDPDQCRAGSKLGFLVHGLWPQFERGFPTECSAVERAPTRQAIEAAADLFPSEGLARHEWRRHGTCSGLSPSAYFAAVRRAREAIRIPDTFREAPPSERRASPREIERAFVEANPGLRTDMMSVACRAGVLQEVRICFSKDLRGFRSCPELDRSGCRGDVVVPAAP